MVPLFSVTERPRPKRQAVQKYHIVGTWQSAVICFKKFCHNELVEHLGLIFQKRKVLIRILLPIRIKVSHPTLPIIIDDRRRVTVAQLEIPLKLAVARLKQEILIFVITLLVHADGAMLGVNDLLARGAADVVCTGCWGGLEVEPLFSVYFALGMVYKTVVGFGNEDLGALQAGQTEFGARLRDGGG
jgi:hypothetical protein